MKKLLLVSLVFTISLCQSSAGLLDFLGFGKKGTNQASVLPAKLESLNQEQIIKGLKEALGKGVQGAVSELGRENGFLTNMNVRIPLPENLRKVENTLRLLRQDRLADEFVSTMNRAAEQAVPEAAGVFAQAVKEMTFDDARAILTGTNNAATEFFRRTTETNLHEKFLPIVQQATAKAGVTSAYKNLTDKVAGTTFGSLGRSLLGAETMDLDSYVTGKALDGLFLMIAEEEKRIREDPAARTTALLQKVFGSMVRTPPGQ